MMTMRSLLLCVCLVVLPSLLVPSGQSTGELKPGRNDVEFEHQGRTRTATILVPRMRTVPPEGWPLVLMLHGAGGSSANVLESTGWAEKGEQEGIILVFPNGTPRDESRPASFSRNPQTWNSGAAMSLSSGTSSASAKNVDDVGFLAGLVQRVCRQLSVDPRRIYVAGHSNGAQMAYRFAFERCTLVAAVGVMAGHSFADHTPLKSPVSLIQIVGDHDPFTPLAGGKAGVLGRTMIVPPALDSPRFWAQSLGIAEEARIVRNDDTLMVRLWGPAPNGAEVRSIVVKGHGHAYLAHQDRFHPTLLFGPTVRSLNATETMWDFFARHPKAR
jgi:polyhydroxybutyrate depolymerase